MVESKEAPAGRAGWVRSVQPLIVNLGQIMLALGMVAVSGIGLQRGEFVAKWGTPPSAFAGWTALARCSDLVLLIVASGLLARARIAAKAALGLACLMLIWILALHVPQVISNPRAIVRWGYLAGVVTVGSGALGAWATSTTTPITARWLFVARALMGSALVWFGISHMLFASAVIVLVPAALPFKLQIVELTGCAHLAAGVALIAGVIAPEAALLEAIMLSSFIALVDLPRFLRGVVRGPPWALCFETAMAGAVWCMASALTAMKRVVAEQELDSGGEGAGGGT